MEAIIFPRWPGIFKETRVLPTLLLLGISYLTGDLLLREPPLGMQAAKKPITSPVLLHCANAAPPLRLITYIWRATSADVQRELSVNIQGSGGQITIWIAKMPKKKYDQFEVFITLRMAFSTSEYTLKAATRQMSLTWLLAKLIFFFKNSQYVSDVV